jgi:hypothetical protein
MAGGTAEVCLGCGEDVLHYEACGSHNKDWCYRCCGCPEHAEED